MSKNYDKIAAVEKAIKEKYNVAVVGATGIVGESLLDILHSRKFPIEKIHAVASQKSKGSKAKFGDELITVEALDEFFIITKDGANPK